MSKLFVVEMNDGRAYLGRVERLIDGAVIIKTGLRGHPPVLDLGEVDRIVPADRHPDVVVMA